MKRIIGLLFIFILMGCSISPRPTQVSIPEEIGYTIYIPLIFVESFSLGVQVWGNVDKQKGYLVDGSMVLVPIYWNDAEEIQGTYNMKDNINLDPSNPLMISVRNSPEWARDGDLECSPPKKEYYQAYADFVLYALEYYDAFAVEVWNEPDTAKDIGDHLAPFLGCWGKGIAAGKDYGELVDKVSNTLDKSLSASLLVAGALNDGIWETNGFYQGMKDSNYDILSFHAYVVYPGKFYDFIEWKADHFKDAGRPMWVTETSLLCNDDARSCGEVFENEQAYYLGYVLQNAWNSVDGIFWFTLYGNNWLNSDLAYGGRKKLSWYVYEDWLEYRGSEWGVYQYPEKQPETGKVYP